MPSRVEKTMQANVNRHYEIDLVTLQLKRYQVRLAQIGEWSQEAPRVKRAIAQCESILETLQA